MSDIREKISFEELTQSAGDAAAGQAYESWKEDKIRKALAQAEDRSSMIPAEKVWEQFGFER